MIAISITACHLNKIVYCLFQQLRHSRNTSFKRVSPRVLADNSSVVGRIFYGRSGISLLVFVSKNLATHKSHATTWCSIASSNTRNALSIVVTSRNSAGHVGAMPFVVGFYLAPNNIFCLNKVVAIDIINKSVSIIVNTCLTIFLLLIHIKIVNQVFVRHVYTTINNGNNHIAFTCCVFLPSRFNIAIVVIMPLFRQKRVVKKATALLRGCFTASVSTCFNLGVRYGQNPFSTFHTANLIELLQHGIHIFTFVKINCVPAI